LIWGCDQSTTQQASQPVATTATPRTYVSPPVQTVAEPIPALPADSIPVSYTAKGVAAAPLEFVPMMGEWVSTYDEGEELRFEPGKYISFYEGQKVVEEHMVYYRNCPNACGDGQVTDKACFVLASDYSQSCFAIVKHTPEELQLSMLGSTDPESILKYKRKH
ncbi:MAG: hypothetical protein AAGJ82_13835, partial [Bacteroidota bacterium]